jgi:PAS domain-containing protein
MAGSEEKQSDRYEPYDNPDCETVARNFTITKSLDKRIDTNLLARRSTEGHRKRSWIVQTGVTFYLDTWERHNSGIITPGGITTPGRARPQLFHERVDLSQYTDDNYLRAAIDRSLLMVWVTSADNQCIHISPMLFANTFRSFSSFLGTGWLGALHASDRERVHTESKLSFQSREPMQNVYYMQYADLSFRRVVSDAVPRYREDGTFLGYVGTIYSFDSHAQVETAFH